jgi:hypothetical protein
LGTAKGGTSCVDSGSRLRIRRVLVRVQEGQLQPHQRESPSRSAGPFVSGCKNGCKVSGSSSLDRAHRTSREEGTSLASTKLRCQSRESEIQHRRGTSFRSVSSADVDGYPLIVLLHRLLTVGMCRRRRVSRWSASHTSPQRSCDLRIVPHRVTKQAVAHYRP